jgi:hypothetical protein
MTNKINQGDCVEVLDTSDNRSSATFKTSIGKRYIVDEVRGNFLSLRGVKRKGWSMSRFKVVSPNYPKADEVVVGQYIIILRDENGVLLPAKNPKVYLTDTQAMKIGEVMAKKHGGTFQVFKAIGEYDMPKITTPTFRKL